MNDAPTRWLLALIATVAGGAGLALAAPVAAPLAFALFTIALAWPVQLAVQRRAGAGAGMLAATALALLVVLALTLAASWAIGRVAQWVLANGALLTALWAQKAALLEGWGLGEAPALDPRLALRLAREAAGQAQGALSFAVVTLVFAILGLLEVGVVARHLAARGTPGALAVLEAARETGRKLRAYMAVRTAMSLATGLLVWAYARAAGLDLALEWGVLAFVLNYIPFLGSLVATLLPTAAAALQFGDWQAALLTFAAVQAIQFVVGSYVEPRVAGRSLALSPLMVLLAVFLGALVWGVPGAFLGVPVLIASVTLLERFPGTRFAAALMSGRAP